MRTVAAIAKRAGDGGMRIVAAIAKRAGSRMSEKNEGEMRRDRNTSFGNFELVGLENKAQAPEHGARAHALNRTLHLDTPPCTRCTLLSASPTLTA